MPATSSSPAKSIVALLAVVSYRNAGPPSSTGRTVRNGAGPVGPAGCVGRLRQATCAWSRRMLKFVGYA